VDALDSIAPCREFEPDGCRRDGRLTYAPWSGGIFVLSLQLEALDSTDNRLELDGSFRYGRGGASLLLDGCFNGDSLLQLDVSIIVAVLD
jgi:hypothetical protein